MKTLLLAALLATAAVPAPAQHHSPYAGEQHRGIKALSERDLQELRSGHGMGLAKSAELNGYPGPTHVLELSDELGLSEAQRASTEALMRRHKATARDMGAALIDAEATLDRAFADRTIDEQRLARLTDDIGRRQAALRAEHLRTHLAQTALLTPQQIARYAQLRGYGPHGSATHSPHSHR